MKKLTFWLLLFFSACNIPLKEYSCDIPKFNADTAYAFIVKQVKFGPRTPGITSHDSCAIFLSNKLKSYGALVEEQNATVKRFDSIELEITNIIAKFYPEKKNRILLFTHWDTRFMSDFENGCFRNMPLTGANDGASGTALLLEVARQLSITEPHVGVDIILFDAEDQGAPLDEENFNELDWGLGSQYWTKTLKKNPKYLYGLGVDMVAAKNAKFAIEDISLNNYGFLIKRIWQIAADLGYDTLFINKRTGPLINEHLFLYRNIGLRSVMIVENLGRGKHYGDYWHTQNDDLNIIDTKVLNAVGQVVLCVVYNEK